MSRREFLQGTAVLGLTAAAPALLPGCESEPEQVAEPVPTPTPAPQPTGPREQRTLHFDLSMSEVREAELIALNSTSHRTRLVPHTGESRQRFRQQSAVLASLPDTNLTHYVEAADLPADSLQHLMLEGKHVRTGERTLVGMYIHGPATAVRNLATRQAAARTPPPRQSAKLKAYNIPHAAVRATDDALVDLKSFASPIDTAIALVFHHPAVMNLDTQQGASILDLIENLPCQPNDPNCTPLIGTLAQVIGESPDPTTTPGGWGTLVPQTQLDGTPALDDSGQPVYRLVLSPDTMEALGTVVRGVTRAIANDPQYEGSNWHATPGLAAVEHPHSAAAVTTRARAQPAGGPVARQETGFRVSATLPPGSTNDGVNFISLEVTDQATRTVQLELKNRYLRTLSAYVQYFDAAGNALPVDSPIIDDTRRAKFLDHVLTNDSILGIPLVGDDVATTTLQFKVPNAASRADVIFGSLGLGYTSDSEEALYGAIITGVFNIGIPTLLLAIGVCALVGEVKALMKASAQAGGVVNNAAPAVAAPNLATQLARAVKHFILVESPDFGSGIYGAAASSDARPFLLALGNIGIGVLFDLAPTIIGKFLAGKIAEATLKKVVPIVGTALQIVSIAADLAAILQTIVEVTTSAAIFTNTISLTMTTTLTINKDPDDFRFPARATKYRVTATYDNQAKPHTVPDGTIEPGRVDPIVVVLSDVPAGGKVTIDVKLLTDDDWLVGTGTVGPIANTPESAGAVSVTIKELLIPLTDTTQYLHQLKLAYSTTTRKRAWVAAPAPVATQADLCNGQDNALCRLNGITVNQPTGMVGYGFQAGGQGVVQCNGGPGGILHTFQNVFLGQDPERALKFSGCGFTQPAGMVYELLARDSATGRHFFLQPNDSGSFDLRSIVLDNTTPFDLRTTLSWGRFTQALDSLVVHPSGYVIGVSSQTHTMEVLRLPTQPVSDAVAPQSVPFAVVKGGNGTRVGLLDTPVAVAVSQHTVYVLEQGNRRIQAFDETGNPVMPFQQTSFTALMNEGPNVVYLDIGVESQGYMYVLSYINNGLTASDYRLDIYAPDGSFLSRTTGVAAARMAVDNFRNMYALNYETLANSPRKEPSVSQWAPSTPGVMSMPAPTPS
jgi:hypothetical protein